MKESLNHTNVALVIVILDSLTGYHKRRMKLNNMVKMFWRRSTSVLMEVVCIGISELLDFYVNILLPE